MVDIFASDLLGTVLDVMYNQVDVILHDFEFCDSSVVLGILGGLRVSVTHDRNQHVEEDDLDEEWWAQEEDVAQGAAIAIGILLITGCIGIDSELTEAQFILVLKSIDEP